MPTLWESWAKPKKCVISIHDPKDMRNSLNIVRQEKMMNITKPNRKKHSYTQHPNASPEAVFPLLCPVAESKWTPGWMPEVVFSVSGVVEQECIFMTTPEFPSEPQNSI